MASVKIPVAVWQDFFGNWTAVTLDGESISALGPDEANALRQLKSYLEWSYKKIGLGPDIDFNAPVIDQIDIDLRPRHQTTGGDHYPAEIVINARFRYVWAKRKDGTLICCLPTINERFFCRKSTQLKALVRDHVQRRFADATSADMATCLFAQEIKTGSIQVKTPRAKSTSVHHYELNVLPEVAIPLSDRESKKQFGTAWNREHAIRLVQQFLKQNTGSAILLGDTGVGKTTILAEACRKHHANIRNSDDEAEKALPHVQRYWLTNSSRLIAGMQYLGQWEQRCELVIEELAEIRGVLCIENLLALLHTGNREPNASLAAFFQNFMVNGELRLIGEATKPELDTMRRLLPGFDSHFKIIPIEELTKQQAIKSLKDISDHYKQAHHFEIDQAAVGLTYHLFKRFLPYDPFPGRCASFWYQLFEDRISNRPKAISPHELAADVTIGTDDIIQRFVSDTGLPELLVRDELLIDFPDVVADFQSNIVGQTEACRAMADMVTTFKAAMNDPTRPIGVYFFCGPTGVGKTEMAKTVAKYLFGSADQKDNRLIRLDMSEYATPGASERLLTQSNGQPSELVESIRQQPFVVLLFDEIEKASTEIFDTLMNVFDEGRLTDRMGRVTNFCSCVIIMTSNLGTSVSDPIGFDESRTPGYEKEVRKFFRPEFFNRLDQVISFNHLSESDIENIARKEIENLKKRAGLSRRNLRLVCDPEVIKFVAEQGYDRKLGARPLQRVVERFVVTPIARWLSENPQVESLQLELVFEDGRVNCRPQNAG